MAVEEIKHEIGEQEFQLLKFVRNNFQAIVNAVGVYAEHMDQRVHALTDADKATGMGKAAMDLGTSSRDDARRIAQGLSELDDQLWASENG
jgi:hypothetical protein